MRSDIAIIGAGIAGITTAYALAKKGHKVTLIDSRRYPAMATSYANGGQLRRVILKLGILQKTYSMELSGCSRRCSASF